MKGINMIKTRQIGLDQEAITEIESMASVEMREFSPMARILIKEALADREIKAKVLEVRGSVE